MLGDVDGPGLPRDFASYGVGKAIGSGRGSEWLLGGKQGL